MVDFGLELRKMDAKKKSETLIKRIEDLENLVEVLSVHIDNHCSWPEGISDLYDEVMSDDKKKNS